MLCPATASAFRFLFAYVEQTHAFDDFVFCKMIRSSGSHQRSILFPLGNSGVPFVQLGNLLFSCGAGNLVQYREKLYLVARTTTWKLCGTSSALADALFVHAGRVDFSDLVACYLFPVSRSLKRRSGAVSLPWTLPRRGQNVTFCGPTTRCF